MASVYSSPAELGPVPDFKNYKDKDGRIDFAEFMKAEKIWIDSISNFAKEKYPGEKQLAGEVITFPVGDGRAVYVVLRTNPPELIHCPIGDNWAIPDAHERGLRTKDIKDLVNQRKRLDLLFNTAEVII